MNGLREEELELVVASKSTISSLSISSSLIILIIANPGSGVSHSSGLSLVVFPAQQNYYYGPSLDSNLEEGEHNFPHFLSPTLLHRYPKKIFHSAVNNFIVAKW